MKVVPVEMSELTHLQSYFNACIKTFIPASWQILPIQRQKTAN